MNTKTIFITLLFLCTKEITLGQQKNSGKVIKDSIVTENALRIAIGAHRNFYSEIGFARYESNKRPGCGFGHESPSGYYSSIEWTAKTQNYKDVFGIKVGFEILASLFAPAIEVKYVTNFEQKDVVFTPKIGFGNPDLKWYIFYGYNISTNGNPFPNVGRHQFSLVFNLNKNSFGK